MYRNVLVGAVIILVLFSCKKEEQSCYDGKHSPDKEEKTDCGGVCKPCYLESTEITSYLFATIKNKEISFQDISLHKFSDWRILFLNDTLEIKLNFGDGDSLGGRPLKISSSYAKWNNKSYSTLLSGLVLFSEINHSKNYLSGYFRAKFLSDTDQYDTLVVESGEFSHISW